MWDFISPDDLRGKPEPPGALSRVQAWLRGWPDKDRPWPLAWVGNRVSDLRCWLWRLSR